MNEYIRPPMTVNSSVSDTHSLRVPLVEMNVLLEIAGVR